MRIVFTALISIAWVNSIGQNVESFGFFGGLNFPVTIDEGLQKDPRYFGDFTIRGTPIGFSYGYDKVGHGFVITPQYLQIGQKYTIKNAINGEIGTREIQMNYFSLPVALKIHINDLAFFRLSGIAALNFNYLLSGKEIINHSASKVKYPIGISIPTTPGYTVDYDGVFIPEVHDLEYVATDKFNAFQIFAALGLRSDFDLSDKWSINFDGRVNFGILDPRQTSYLSELKKPTGPADINGNSGAPDLPGQRREIYLTVDFGLSYIIQSKNKFKTKRTSIKNRGGNSDHPKPRNKKPKG